MWINRGVVEIGGELVRLEDVTEGPETGDYSLKLTWPDGSQLYACVTARDTAGVKAATDYRGSP